MMWLFSDNTYKDNINDHENKNGGQIEQSNPEIW